MYVIIVFICISLISATVYFFIILFGYVSSVKTYPFRYLGISHFSDT